MKDICAIQIPVSYTHLYLQMIGRAFSASKVRYTPSLHELTDILSLLNFTIIFSLISIHHVSNHIFHLFPEPCGAQHLHVRAVREQFHPEIVGRSQPVFEHRIFRGPLGFTDVYKRQCVISPKSISALYLML